MTTCVRLLCVDVGDAADAASASAVTRAVAMAASYDRLLCFGRAAVVAASLDRQERAEREGIWLDTAAAWLLGDDSPDEPPVRPRPGPLQSRAIVIGRPGLETGGLQLTERLVELAGGLLVMAVPSPAGVDAVDNAHLWLVGGQPFNIDTQQGKAGGRAVIGVGGSIVGVVVDGAEAAVSAWHLSGEQRHPTQAILLGGQSKMSVRSATP